MKVNKERRLIYFIQVLSICFSNPCNLSQTKSSLFAFHIHVIYHIFVEPMKLFVSFDGSYSNTVEDHFITLIWCKCYVGVIHTVTVIKKSVVLRVLGNPKVMHTYRRQEITLSLSPVYSYLHSPSGASTTFVSSHTAITI